MISSEAIDNIQIIPQRLLIFWTGQAGSNFSLCTECCQVFGVHKQVVRANFTSHGQTLQQNRYLARLFHSLKLSPSQICHELFLVIWQ